MNPCSVLAGDDRSALLPVSRRTSQSSRCAHLGEGKRKGGRGESLSSELVDRAAGQSSRKVVLLPIYCYAPGQRLFCHCTRGIFGIFRECVMSSNGIVRITLFFVEYKSILSSFLGISRLGMGVLHTLFELHRSQDLTLLYHALSMPTWKQGHVPWSIFIMYRPKFMFVNATFMILFSTDE